MGTTELERFVAVLLPSSPLLIRNIEYYRRMLEGLNLRLAETGLSMRPMQAVHAYQQESFVRRAAERPYAGAVFVALYSSEGFVRRVVECVPGPKVVLDHHFEDIPIHSVREDAAAGMRQVAHHLADLGHKRVAYVDLPDVEANPWKRGALIGALKERGVELPRAWQTCCRNNDADVDTAVGWLLSHEPAPTAIACCDDARALRVLRSLQAADRAVPREVSVAGFGDKACWFHRSSFLTSVRYDIAELGRRAAGLVLGPADAAPRQELVPVELVARRTTAPPPES